MKLSTLIMLFVAGVLTVTNASGQANASINILTQNSGLVDVGGTVFLEVTVNNTGPSNSIGAYKIKTQISVPSQIASIPTTGHTLPAGWTINSNNGSTINLSNGTDIIAVNTARTILIAIEGTTIGGPLTIGSQLSFSNGNPPGTAPGALAGDNTSDNSSQSTVEVTNPTPVTLRDFNALLRNCQPVLSWITEAEINSDRFEIERAYPTTSQWESIATLPAHGNTTARVQYNFIDKDLNTSSEKILYRLKMIDKDGHYKYSPVLSVLVNCKTAQVSAYPNPVQDGRLYVSISGLTKATETTLLTLSGQVVLKKNLAAGTTSLDVSKLSSGEYILSVKDENGFNKKLKVVIQN